MAALAVAEANRVLGAMFSGTPYTAPAAHSLSLHTADPGTSDTPTSEVSTGGYARQSIVFGTPSAGSVANTNVITFPNLPATTSAYLVGWNAAAGSGTPQMKGPLSPSVTTSAGQSITFAAGAASASDV